MKTSEIGSSLIGTATSPSASGDKVVLMVGTDPEMRGGIASVIATLRDGGLFERAQVQFLATHVEGSRWWKALHFVRTLHHIWLLLWRHRVCAVHMHVARNGSFWRKVAIAGLARHFGVPTIFHLHSGGFHTYMDEGFGGPVLRWCARQTLLRSSLVVVLSDRWAAWVQGFAPGCRVEIVPNPISIPADVAGAAHRTSRSTGGVVLYLGLLCKAKGSFDLLHAWAQFRQRVPGWRLVVGGNGEVERFLSEADRLGIRDDVEFLGWITGPAKARALEAADVFVLPSYAEGMPMSVLEAMAHRSAVIVTPVGGVPDMMHEGRHGLWVKPGDVDGLARCLERLALDLPLRERLQEQALQHVCAEFAVDRVVARWCSIYRAIAQAVPETQRI